MYLDHPFPHPQSFSFAWAILWDSFTLPTIYSLFVDYPQGAQEMFQELPHIYVEPHELRKAIQSTGEVTAFWCNRSWVGNLGVIIRAYVYPSKNKPHHPVCVVERSKKDHQCNAYTLTWNRKLIWTVSWLLLNIFRCNGVLMWPLIVFYANFM